MKLSGLRNEYLISSSEVSKLVRQLSFAGVVIAWVFKSSDSGMVKLPNPLIWPLAFFCITLMLDFFQNFIRAEIWRIFCRREELKLTDAPEDPDVTAPVWLPRIIRLFYYTKIGTLIASYIMLFRYLYSITA